MKSFNSTTIFYERILWSLLAIAFVLGGSFEFYDNLNNNRQLNYDSSAPLFIKILKEVSILAIIFFSVLKNKKYNLSYTSVNLFIFSIISLFFSLLTFPASFSAQIGLFYFLISISLLYLTCLACMSDSNIPFYKNFLAPIIVFIFLTQIIEIIFSSSSFYYEDNIFGLDRRAGIAVIPTTAGILGVLGFISFRGSLRLLCIAVIGIANSSISILCLAILLIYRYKESRYSKILIPFISIFSILIIMSRDGLKTSALARIDILIESLQHLNLFGPSAAGALTTAKSVALAPLDSQIIDSMYLEIFHVFGIIPGIIIIIALFMLLLKRAGIIAAAIFFIVGIGYLLIEAWVVWMSIFFALKSNSNFILQCKKKRT